MEKKIFTIENKKGMKLCVLNYGANMQALYVPNAKGEVKDVVLGYDTLDAYEQNESFFGCTVGPIANRTENASYRINGERYHLEVNDNENNLHSNFKNGYHKCFFDIEEAAGKLVCTLFNKEQDIQGSPGNKKVVVTYALSDDNALSISYEVTSDKNTWINMTNHSYFNLSGHDSGRIESHYAQIFSDEITEIRSGSIPTGKLQKVENTPMDFREKQRILERIDEEYEQLQLAGGYDHNYVLKNAEDGLRKVAILSDERAERTMEIYTDLPGVQLYAGNFIGDTIGKNGTVYSKRHGVCFETQYYPNAINIANFPAPITGPNHPFVSKTIYKFL